MSTGSPGGDTQQMAQPNPLDRYEKRQLLRQKDTVEVWKALDLQQQLMVAIKLLRPNIQADRDFPARFLEKLKQVAELGHPNIVHIRDFGFAHAAVVSETKAYIIMDYVEGQTLADYLHKTSREGKFPTATELVRLLIPICLAIDYAHQQGVIHGSLKPGNILLDASNTSVNSMGQPVLSDFGMAHILGSAGGSTVAPSVYTAPEQMQGDADNERSDLYSLGVMVYELFTGVLPFQGKDPVEPIKKRFEAISDASLKPTMLTAVPGILLRNLGKNPTQRFPTAMALVIALGKAFNVPVPNPFVNPVANPPSPLPQIGPAQGTSLSAIPPISPAASPPAQTPLHVPPVSPRPSKRRLYNGLLVALIVLVMMAGSGVGAFILLKNRTIVGHAFFTSSGLVRLTTDNVEGIADGFQINLQGILNPRSGNSYYAWLMSTGTGNPAIPLGTFNPRLGMLSYHDPSRADLLANYSQFLITEEPTAIPPHQPSPNKNTWRYDASFSQMPNSADALHHYHLYDHLKHLLALDPKLQGVGLRGGLDIWLYKNTLKVLEAAGAARDAQMRCTAAPKNLDCPFVLREIGRILGYMDGRISVQSDVPASLLDPTLPPVALIDVNGVNQVPNYLDHIGNHLLFLSSSPGVTQDQMALAIQITQEINNVHGWLEAVRADAKMLVNMNNVQLSQSGALMILDDLLLQATYALNGKFNPDTRMTLEGVAQIHYDIQKLATFDVVPCTILIGQSSCA